MNPLKIKLRLDYIGTGKPSKIFGGKSAEQLAEENRQHKVSLMRNVPIQGIRIDEIDMSQEIYFVLDEITGKSIAYAPVLITFYADGIEDAIKFSMKEEFRTVEVLEPEKMEFTRYEIERLLFKVSEELGEYKEYLVRKMNNWK
ncbi:MAG: hypothetical protein U9N81_01960 [Bacillota bacterium]|nr:hypothetical protein [Bacillota bacterium]